MMKTRIYIPALLMAVILLVAACEKSDLADRVKPAVGARVSFLNLSADVTTTGTVKTNEVNLYFNDVRVTTQRSTVVNRLRGIPFRSSYPGAVTASPTSTTSPTSYPGAEYFIADAGATTITAKDTTLKTGLTTLFTTNFTFEQDKYYSVIAMDLLPTMTPIVVEDNITEFLTKGKVKVRVVNALYGLAAGKIDIWLIHQPATTQLGKAPYKLVENLDYKAVTAFTDTISSGSYKWAVTVGGTVPTAITAPTPDPVTGSLLGKAYTITFPAGTSVIAPAANGTTFSERSTYSFLVFGQSGKTGVIAPYGSLFRNRIN